jgi:hypothetical protein
MTEKEFVRKEVKRITASGIKSFPFDFLHDCETETIEMPGKILIPGEELFGHYEISLLDGTPVFQVAEIKKAKYIIYSSRLKTKNVTIPKSIEDIKTVVTAYHKYIDTIIKEISSNYKAEFPDGENNNLIISEILKVVNLVRY